MLDYQCELPSWGICPSEEVRRVNHGIPHTLSHPAFPYFLIFQTREFWINVVIYTILGVCSRFCARQLYPKRSAKRISIGLAGSIAFAAKAESETDGEGSTRCLTPENPAEEHSKRCKRETLGRYFPSWIHSVAAVYLTSFALRDTHRLADGIHPDKPEEVNTQWVAVVHSLGYFFSDIFVDRDPIFILHHIGPLIYCECVLLLGGSFYHALWFGLICEAGNAICYTCTICTNSMGLIYPSLFMIVQSLSRLLAIVPVILLILCDIPLGHSWMGGIAVFCVLMILCSNVLAVRSVYASFGVMAKIGGKGGSAVVAASGFSFNASKCFSWVAAALGTADDDESSTEADGMMPAGSTNAQKINYGPRIVHDPSYPAYRK